MNFLRISGAAPTAADSFIQGVNFACATCGISAPDGQILISATVKGSADHQFSKKRKLVQATPLTREMVWTLERRACDDPSEYLTLVAGHLCFCLYACCRFADSMNHLQHSCWSHTRGGQDGQAQDSHQQGKEDNLPSFVCTWRRAL